MGNAYAQLGLRSPDRVPVLCGRICDAAAPRRGRGPSGGQGWPWRPGPSSGRWLGARSAKEARSYFATTLRRAWGVHFAREFARHRIRRVVFVGAPRRQPGRPLATADGDWPALSAGEFAAHALRVGGAWAGGPPGRR